MVDSAKDNLQASKHKGWSKAILFWWLSYGSGKEKLSEEAKKKALEFLDAVYRAGGVERAFQDEKEKAAAHSKDAPPVTPGIYSARDEALVQVAIALGMPYAAEPKTVREISEWADKHRPLVASGSETTDDGGCSCAACVAGKCYACLHQKESKSNA